MATKREPTYHDALREIAAKGHQLFGVFQTFCKLGACAMAHGTREEEYLAEVKHWKAEELQLFKQAFHLLKDEMERHPYEDRLGKFYEAEAQSKGTRDWGGEFYTPPAICELMARMIFDKEIFDKADRPVTLMEPCCGGSAQVLAFVKVMKDHEIPPCRLRATVVDVSRLACDMSFINLTLWGIPATVVHANALTLEEFGGWRNLFWWSAHGTAAIPLELAALMHAAEPIEQLKADAKEAVRQAEPHMNKRGQYLLDFDLEASA